MRRVAQTHTEELFLLLSLALCLGVAALVQATGLSLALGAFLAGMIISSSDYGHESLAQLFPMRDAFVALFFVTIGALVNPNVVVTHWKLLLALIAMIVVGKFLIWTLVVSLFRESLQTAMLVAIGLTQIGEFSFILVQVARDAGHLGDEVYSATLTAALMSILINAMLFRFVPDMLNRGRLAQRPEPAAVESLSKHVLICGHGRIGGPVAAALDSFGYPYTVLETDPDIVSDLRKRGVNASFGDPVRKHVLENAGVARASLAVVTIPDKNRSWMAVKNIRQLNQEMPIIVRIQRQSDRDALIHAGATFVVQPEAEASVAMIRLALENLGVDAENYMNNLRDIAAALEKRDVS
jgi:CPA2 family monovalent cation:H+ antiporter-2